MVTPPQPSHEPLPPNSMIGILGGGQLGRMLAASAAQLGFRVCIYSPESECPGSALANQVFVAPYDDKQTLLRFAECVDVVTYEFENIPTATIDILLDVGAVVRPGKAALEIAQDRLVEKQFIQECGAQTAAFHAVNNVADLDAGLQNIGQPAILKTRRLGYDGKGQTRITDDVIDLAGVYKKAVEFAWAEVAAAPSILEAFVPFEREISVIGARGVDGSIKLYEPSENVHSHGILRTSVVPSNTPSAFITQANAITRKILTSLNYIGIIGIEFFQTHDTIIVNEFAPRVHNSGHWTQNACAISQFEQHIRAIAGWPLGDPRRHSDARMENLIGTEAHEWRNVNSNVNTAIHLYGKKTVKPGRKMGHINNIMPRRDGISNNSQ